MTTPKPSTLLLETFGGSLWVQTPKGERGSRPEWANPDGSTRWPHHTAAEMAEPRLPKAARGRAA